MHTYTMLVTRVDTKAGLVANLRVEVKAPDPQSAKRSADAQNPGYKAMGSAARVPGT